MAILQIEKVGGLAGFGGIHAHIRSRGQIDTAALSDADRKAVESLFRRRGVATATQGADAFRFRITRTTAAGTETIEVPETHVPAAVASSVKDELV